MSELLQATEIHENRLHCVSPYFDIVIEEGLALLNALRSKKAASNRVDPTDLWYFQDQITMFYGPKGHFVKALLTFHKVCYSCRRGLRSARGLVCLCSINEASAHRQWKYGVQCPDWPRTPVNTVSFMTLKLRPGQRHKFRIFCKCGRFRSRSSKYMLLWMD